LCHEWEILDFSPSRHPVEFWRKALNEVDVLPNAIVRKIEETDRPLRAAGWVIRPHTPPTKSGKTVVFLSLEDETGLLNVTVFPAAYEKFGHLIYSCPLLIVEGRKDRRGAHSLIADRIWSADELVSPGDRRNS
jgi:error-prone DNA polymerase